MRYAIQIVTSGEYDEALKICRFLREIKAGKSIGSEKAYSDFDTMGYVDFELLAGQLLPPVRKKLGALNGSLNKVERGKQKERRPKSMTLMSVLFNDDNSMLYIPDSRKRVSKAHV